MGISQYNKVLAIDPGASGGLAWKNPDGSLQCRKMPDTEGGLLSLLQEIQGCVTEHQEKVCCIEEVGGFIGKAQPGSAMFKFGFNAGLVRGMLMALGWRVELVRPATWQARLGLGKANTCSSKAEWKRKLKGEAERRFPGVSGVTLATADALLILDYYLHLP
jgi:hypothetical protein